MSRQSPHLNEIKLRVSAPPRETFFSFALFAFFAAKTSPLSAIQELPFRRGCNSRPTGFVVFFMAVMRPHHNCMKRARSQSMPALEALPQACFGHTGERAHVGRVLLAIIRSRSLSASLLHSTWETCGRISSQASFSSSLNCLVYGFKSGSFVSPLVGERG